ncbi:hypothetical protein QR685DRAFT_598755 [Neurospora intermedia]|uniref:Secreted protein n=1 Tax=Neurospora intermedia TaxID=5142 RepID=A0ABR3D8W5_NEUIN
MKRNAQLGLHTCVYFLAKHVEVPAPARSKYLPLSISACNTVQINRRKRRHIYMLMHGPRLIRQKVGRVEELLSCT